MLQSRIATEANILPALSVLDDQCPDIELASKLTYLLNCDDLPSLSAVRRLERRNNSPCRNDAVKGPVVVIAVIIKQITPPQLAGCDAAVNVCR
jgi:hypothetical protein